MSANSLVIKQWLKPVVVAMTILAVGLIVGILVSTIPTAETQPAAIVTENEDSLQRSIDADAARYTAMAEYYAAKNESIQRGIDADAARYTAMGAFYAAKEETSVQRGIDADAARYTAMAEYYAAKKK
ncbi:MAG: hypothetical protein QHJ74_13525 [Anaerolineae bacterium]|nr:hypothetical protein [Anaerolineae bacterium]